MSAAREIVPDASGPWPRRDNAWGALLVACLALAFLWPGIRAFPAGVYAPADIAQSYSLTRLEPGFRPANPNLSDVWVQMHPWAMFARDEFRAGRLPAWNPWNGNGLPHLANYQSAVFSPFSLPFHGLPFEFAVLVAAFAKLFLFGFGTFLFLRALGLVFVAAMFGATAVMFAGQSTVHLALPHSSVACCLPWGLLVLERIAQDFERDPSRGTSAGSFVALAVVLAATTLAGHPETLYFALALLVLYAIGRAFVAWRATRATPHATRGLARLAGRLVLAGTLAAGISAVQLLPFFEYLGESHSLHGRSSDLQTPLPAGNWALQAFPNLLGNPSNVYFLDFTLPEPDFTTATLGYVGIVVVFLGLVSLVLARRDTRVAILAAIACVWFAYAHDLLGLARVLQAIPTVHLAPMNRSQCVWQVCLAACAAFALDRVLRTGPAGRGRATSAILVTGTVVLFVFRAGAGALVARTATERALTGDRLALLDLGSSAHVARISILFAVAVALFALIRFVRSPRIRQALAAGLVALAAVESGALFARYNPTTPAALVYPRTPAIEGLASALHGRDFVVLGPDGIPPASNAVYGLRQIAAYDALAIRRYDELYVDLFGRGDNWRPIQRATIKSLQLFGVECVLDRDGWPEVETAFAHLEPDQVHHAAAGDLSDGVEVVQELTGVKDALEALRVRFVRPRVLPDCVVEARLEDVSAARTIATARVAARDLRLESDATLALDLVFERIEDSAARGLRLRLSSSDARSGNTLAPRMRVRGRELLQDTLQRMQSRWMKSGEEHPDVARWTLRHGETRLDGHLDLDLAFARSNLVREREIGPFTLYAVRDAVPRFHTVGRAIAARNDAEARALVTRQRIDPAREVVLSDAPGTAAAEADTSPEPDVRVVREEPGRFELEVRRSRPGWLVTALPWYPGWTARVNGEPRRLSRANHAFVAVELSAGPSTVELQYEPLSVRVGAGVSLASALALAIAAAILARRRPRTT